MTQDIPRQTIPPAPGTYPAPDCPPPPAAPAPPQRVRRVGTFTMGLCLIASGVILVLYIFLPQLNILLVLRCLPLVLVLLGTEILVSAIFSRNQKLKYDGLSIFFSLILMGISFAGAALPTLLRFYNGSMETESRLEAQLEMESYNLLSGETGIYSLRWVVFLDSLNYREDMQTSDLGPQHSPQVQVQMEGPYESAADFAADCHRILQKLKQATPYIRYASFYSYPSDNFIQSEYRGNALYQLRLDSVFQINWSAQQMEQNLSTLVWYENWNEYVDESLYRQETETLSDENSDVFIEEDLPNLLLIECSSGQVSDVFSYSFSLVENDDSEWQYSLFPKSGSVGLELYHENTDTYYVQSYSAYAFEELSLPPGEYSLVITLDEFTGSCRMELD